MITYHLCLTSVSPVRLLAPAISCGHPYEFILQVAPWTDLRTTNLTYTARGHMYTGYYIFVKWSHIGKTGTQAIERNIKITNYKLYNYSYTLFESIFTKQSNNFKRNKLLPEIHPLYQDQTFFILIYNFCLRSTKKGFLLSIFQLLLPQN